MFPIQQAAPTGTEQGEEACKNTTVILGDVDTKLDVVHAEKVAELEK